jgi:hypothetical protein
MSEKGLQKVEDRLVSPNGFDGMGPTPEKVLIASKRIAALRVKFITCKHMNKDGTCERVEGIVKPDMVSVLWQPK